jgi:flagellar FliL protein
MADDEETETSDAEEGSEKKKKGKGMLFGIIGAFVLGGAGFYATFSGLLLGDGGEEKKPAIAMMASNLPTFVPIEPLIISLGAGASSKHLKFSAELDVAAAYSDEVTAVMPRILDVLNTFLRAVEDGDIENPSAMSKLRAQMLRRVQIVTGEGRVNDLLITEFVLN